MIVTNEKQLGTKAMGEEQKMQLFIGSTPLDAIPQVKADFLESENNYDISFQVKDFTPLSVTFNSESYIDKDFVNLLRKPKFPRKLKKAVGQMWNIERKDNECKVSVRMKRKTKWQRKASRMVRCNDGEMCIPMKNGTTAIIDF